MRCDGTLHEWSNLPLLESGLYNLQPVCCEMFYSQSHNWKSEWARCWSWISKAEKFVFNPYLQPTNTTSGALKPQFDCSLSCSLLLAFMLVCCWKTYESLLSLRDGMILSLGSSLFGCNCNFMMHGWIGMENIGGIKTYVVWLHSRPSHTHHHPNRIAPG